MGLKDFSDEPGTKVPVHTSCGHWICNSYGDQSAPSGDFSCPKCEKRSRTTRGMKTTSLPEGVLDQHKISLRGRSQSLIDGTDEPGCGTLLSRIYIDLYITEIQSEEINTQHEIWQLETASKMETLHDTPIKCHDIFKALPGQKRHIRVVLTNGLAGSGKTSKVQKFTLDWAEGLENQDIGPLILLPFRELNLVKDEQHSLLSLLHVFHPTLLKVKAEKLTVCKPLFIFDGLDESRLSLDFESDEVVSDVTQKSSLSALLTNLIKGNLLPSALVWITSRPAAANRIPSTYVDRVTEVRGFTDAQKEEYIRRRFSDEDLSNRIISHIKTSRSLHIVCRIPVLCWITATVLEDMLTTDQKGELPETLTDLYSHFLLVQTKRKELKFAEGQKMRPWQLMETNREVLLKLGKLAFKQLDTGNLVFYQEELEHCGLDVTEILLKSGVCTEIFKSETVIFEKMVYRFVHLSVQEFLAAVYMFHCFTDTEALKAFFDEDDTFIDDDDDDDSFIDDDDDSSFIDDDDDDSFIDDDDDDSDNRHNPSLDVVLRKSMDKALESKNGHLDLFVRFLHGLSLKSNQRRLRGLLGQTDSITEITKKVIKNLKECNTNEISPDRSINIFCCLMEMNERSVHQAIQKVLKSRNRSKKKLSEIQCSGLAYMLLTSEEVLDELDLDQYRAPVMGKQRLVAAVRNCRKARLSKCELSTIHCNTVALALKSNPSHLRELDLSYNYLGDVGGELLSRGLESPHCRLESLRLRCCEIRTSGCAFLASALKSNPSSLRELDLSENKLKDSGVKELCDYFLKNPQNKLEILRLKGCGLSEFGCPSLVSALESNPYNLRELDLSMNQLYNSGVKELCDFLGSPKCRLKTLRLSGCRLTHERCFSLAAVLKSSHCQLRDLDLSRNKLNDLGVRLLCTGLKSPHRRLETLRLKKCGLSGASCAHLASALKSNPSHLRELDLRSNVQLDSGVKPLSELVQSSSYRLKTLRFCNAEGRPVTLTGDRQISDLEKDRSESPGSSCDQLKGRPPVLTDEPRASSTKVDGSETTATPDRHDGRLQDPSTSRTNLDVSEDCSDEGAEEKDQLYPDDDVCEAVLNTKNNLSFTPELLAGSGKNSSYRFRCPGPGVFQCTVTELVFVMAQEAELLYRTVQWDESLLITAGKMAAGLLFDIKCSEKGAVCQLHLPHCEIMDRLLPEGLLSVVHISEVSMDVLDPLEITDTHVVVQVSHFSALGIVKDFFKWLWHKNNNTRPVRGQVLLFLGQPNPKTQRQKLNVFLLPRNIHLDQVSVQQRHSENIQAPSKCKLIEDQSYTLHCPQAFKIQPERADFDLEFGPNYHPTFEVRLPANKEEVTLTVKDQRQRVVWKHNVDLTDSRRETPENSVPAADGAQAEEWLRSVRTEFIKRVSEPNLNQLLDGLLKHQVISDAEMQSLRSQVGADKTRDVIDTVQRKGREACSILMAAIRQVDSHLFGTLNSVAVETSTLNSLRSLKLCSHCTP